MIQDFSSEDLQREFNCSVRNLRGVDTRRAELQLEGVSSSITTTFPPHDGEGQSNVTVATIRVQERFAVELTVSQPTVAPHQDPGSPRALGPVSLVLIHPAIRSAAFMPMLDSNVCFQRRRRRCSWAAAWAPPCSSCSSSLSFIACFGWSFCSSIGPGSAPRSKTQVRNHRLTVKLKASLLMSTIT